MTCPTVLPAPAGRHRRVVAIGILATALVTLFAMHAATAQTYRYTGAFGTSGAGALSYPQFVKVDPVNRNILVSDGNNGRVVVYSPSGGYLSQFGSSGSSDGQFVNIAGMAVDAGNHHIYVADYGADRIEAFDGSGNYLDTFGTSHITSPCDLLVVPGSGDILATDGYAHTIQRYDSNESYQSEFGNLGYSCGLARDALGNILVADQVNNDIDVFTANYAYSTAIGGPGAGNGQFGYPGPGGLDIDPLNQDIVVADASGNRVEVFDANGAYLGQFGSTGNGPGQFQNPTSVAIDPVTRTLYVVDRGNNRIQSFAACGAAPVSLSILPMTAEVNQDVLFSAQVSNIIPHGGTFTFFVDGSQACIAPIGDIGGSCTAHIGLGTHVSVAEYSGDGYNSSGCSAAGSVTVVTNTMQIPTDAVLVGDPNVALGLDQDELLTLTETVSEVAGAPLRPNVASNLDGYVTFYDGSNVLVHVPLSNGQAVYANRFAGGAHHFSAVYSGDGTYATSNASVDYTATTPSDDIYYDSFEPSPGP